MSPLSILGFPPSPKFNVTLFYFGQWLICIHRSACTGKKWSSSEWLSRLQPSFYPNILHVFQTFYYPCKKKRRKTESYQLPFYSWKEQMRNFPFLGALIMEPQTDFMMRSKQLISLFLCLKWRYNSHTIKFTLLKCTIQGIFFSIHAWLCSNCKLQNIFITPKNSHSYKQS